MEPGGLGAKYINFQIVYAYLHYYLVAIYIQQQNEIEGGVESGSLVLFY